MNDFIYIMSASHSGSTLLTLLLASHPEVATIGETLAVQAQGGQRIDTGLCSCGVKLAECSFWRQLGKRIGQRGISWDWDTFQTEFSLPDSRWTNRVLQAEYQGPFLETVRDAFLALSPTWRKKSPRIFRNNLIMIEEVTCLLNARVFVDSSKEPHRLKFFLRMPELKTRVIHLVRDGRGVTSSYMRRSQWSAGKSADEWRRSIRSEEFIVRRIGPQAVIQLRYEDLCRDVKTNMGKLFEFIGIDPGRWNPDFRSREHHILGNRMRMENSSEITLDEQWRDLLNAADLEVFESVAGELNRKYGYQ